MANYTTTDDVIAELGLTDIPASVQAQIPAWITEEGQVIDASLPNYNTPFRDVTDTQSTPGLIKKACRFLVCDRVLRRLGLLRYDENGSVIESYKREGERVVNQLRDGTAVIPEGQL